ncbi:Transcriptional activator NphR [compost metagenome]
MIRALLKTSADIATEQGVEVVSRQSISEKRMAEVEYLISLNLSNPDFSLTAAALACKISPRYLCHVLRENGTTFSELLWSKRLEKSREWLLILDKRHYSISEIALSTGFKSAAHFSRMFREHYGGAPSEFRRQAGTQGTEKY